MQDIPEGEQETGWGKKVRFWLLEQSAQSLRREHKRCWGLVSSGDLSGSLCTADPQRARSQVHQSLWPVLVSVPGMALLALLRAYHASPISGHPHN